MSQNANRNSNLSKQAPNIDGETSDLALAALARRFATMFGVECSRLTTCRYNVRFRVRDLLASV